MASAWAPPTACTSRDAEQGAGGQHGRVRQAAAVGLRRRRHGDRADAGDLGRDDVHHHRGGIGHQAARHVYPGPADRDEAAGDGEAVGDAGWGSPPGAGPGAPAWCGGPPLPGPVLTPGSRRGQRLVERVLRHQGGGQVHAVETGGVLAHRLRAAAPDVVADGADQGRGGLDVGGGPGQDPGQGGPAEPVRVRARAGRYGKSPAQSTESAVPAARLSTCRDAASVPRGAGGAPLSASRMTPEVHSGQNASALLAPSASEAWKKAPVGLDASRWL